MSELSPDQLIEQTGGEVVDNKNKSVTVTQSYEADVDVNDLIIPRAKLLQALSPECSEGECKPGQIINSLTKEELPSEFIPIFYSKNWIKFNPRNTKDPSYNPAYEPGALIYRTDNPMDEKLNRKRSDGRSDRVFGPNGERPRATVFMNFFSYFKGVDMPVVVSFCNTSLKAGRELLSLSQFLPGLKGKEGEKVIYGWSYKLTTNQQETDGNKYFVYKIAKGTKTDKKDLDVVIDWYEQYKPKKHAIQADGEVLEY